MRRAKISGPAVKSGGLSVIKMADVCVGSLADIKERISDVRFTPRKQTFCSAQKESAMCHKQTSMSRLLYVKRVSRLGYSGSGFVVAQSSAQCLGH